MNRLGEHDIVELSLDNARRLGRRGDFEARILAFSERTVTLEALHKGEILALPEKSNGIVLTAPFQRRRAHLVRHTQARFDPVPVKKVAFSRMSDVKSVV